MENQNSEKLLKYFTIWKNSLLSLGLKQNKKLNYDTFNIHDSVSLSSMSSDSSDDDLSEESENESIIEAKVALKEMESKVSISEFKKLFTK